MIRIQKIKASGKPKITLIGSTEMHTAEAVIEVQSGAVHESIGIPVPTGTAHLAEHLVLQSGNELTAEYTKPLSNFFITHNTTHYGLTEFDKSVYYIQARPQDMKIAIAILLLNMQNPEFTSRLFDRNKNAIKDEIKDAPRKFPGAMSQYVILNKVFGNDESGVIYDKFGTNELIDSISEANVYVYLEKRYKNNTNISVWIKGNPFDMNFDSIVREIYLRTESNSCEKQFDFAFPKWETGIYEIPHNPDIFGNTASYTYAFPIDHGFIPFVFNNMKYLEERLNLHFRNVIPETALSVNIQKLGNIKTMYIMLRETEGYSIEQLVEAKKEVFSRFLSEEISIRDFERMQKQYEMYMRENFNLLLGSYNMYNTNIITYIYEYIQSLKPRDFLDFCKTFLKNPIIGYSGNDDIKKIISK